MNSITVYRSDEIIEANFVELANTFDYASLGGDLIATKIINRLKSPNSKDMYRREMRRFSIWLGGRDFTEANVLAYVARMETSGLSAATVNLRLSIIRSVAREAKSERLLSGWEADKIIAVKDRGKVGVRSANWLEMGQVMDILDECDGTPQSIQDRALLMIGVTTGLRREEIASLTWDQLKRRKRKHFLMGVKVKGGKVRDLVIQKDAYKWLIKWQKISGKKGPIFRQIRKNGKILESGVTGKTIGRMAQRVGGIAPHDMRRTYAALLYEEGHKIREIQTLLGHSSVITTERYLKPIKDASVARDDLIKFRR